MGSSQLVHTQRSSTTFTKSLEVATWKRHWKESATRKKQRKVHMDALDRRMHLVERHGPGSDKLLVESLLTGGQIVQLLRKPLVNRDKGPVVGRINEAVEVRDLKSLESTSYEIDIEGYAGTFARELLHARQLKTKPLTAVSCNTSALTQEKIDEFLETGITVLEDVISDQDIENLRTHVASTLRLSRLNHGQDPDIRSDEIKFVNLFSSDEDKHDRAEEEDDQEDLDDDQDAEEEAQSVTVTNSLLLDGFQLVENFAVRLEEQWSKFTLLRPPQAMVARYPGRGAHYTTHLDNERAPDGHWRNFRGLTGILYLNPKDWQDANGGQLQFESPQSVGEPRCGKIQPIGGTVVLFDSTRVRHEVLPASRDRYAMTLWFVTADLLSDDFPPCGPRLYALLPHSPSSSSSSSSSRNCIKRNRDDGTAQDNSSNVAPSAKKNHIDTVANQVAWSIDQSVFSDQKDSSEGFSFGFLS